MDGSDSKLSELAQTAQTTPFQAAWRGARETPFLPSFILFSTFLGFGALTSQTGLSWLDTLFMSAFIFALPGQVVLVDQMARGASLLTATIAVTATGVRLLPMTVALLPMIRDRQVPKWMELAVCHFVAVTVWLEFFRRGPGIPRHLRAAYVLGIGAILITSASSGAMIGFFVAENVPALVAAGLLFMTPLYFLLGMLTSARSAEHLMPILFGLGLGPLFHHAFPNIDLVLTGLIGGTLSFLIMRFGVNRKGRS